MELARPKVLLEFVVDTSVWMNEELASGPGTTSWEATGRELISAYSSMDARYYAVGQVFYPTLKAEVAADSAECLTASRGVPVAPLDSAQLERLTRHLHGVAPSSPPGTLLEAWRHGLGELQTALQSPPAGWEDAPGYLVVLTAGVPSWSLECGGAEGEPEKAGYELLEQEVGGASPDIRTIVLGLPGSDAEHEVPVELAEFVSEGAIELESESQWDDPGLRLYWLSLSGQARCTGCSFDGPTSPQLTLTADDELVPMLQAAIVEDLGVPSDCVYRMPESPDVNVFVNPDSAQLFYYAAGSDTATVLEATNDQCATGAFTVDEDGSIVVCDAACSMIREDPRASLQVRYDCACCD